ncbi:hypothetical protein N8482_01495 [Chitinophagales bacterium]|nr:hypothetical protein [Chitinophagales bacterium]
MDQYSMFQTLEGCFVKEVWALTDQEQTFSLIELQYKGFVDRADQTGGSRIYFRDQALAGYLETSREHGQVIIRQETMVDKVIELFSSIELDFESHKKFSDSYYVVTDNKELTRKSFSYEFLNLVSNFKGLEIEIASQKCSFRMTGLMTAEKIMQLAEFGLSLADLVNKQEF